LEQELGLDPDLVPVLPLLVRVILVLGALRIREVVTVSAVLPLTGPGLLGAVGAVVPVIMPLALVLGLAPDPATVLLLLVVGGKHL